jgi:hypothetical protein
VATWQRRMNKSRRMMIVERALNWIDDEEDVD